MAMRIGNGGFMDRIKRIFVIFLKSTIGAFLGIKSPTLGRAVKISDIWKNKHFMG